MASSPSSISSQGEKRQLTYASLHDQLRKEQEPHPAPVVSNTTTAAGGSEDSEEAKKLEDSHRWEEDAFSPTEIDEDELRRFLEDAFVRGADYRIWKQKKQAMKLLSDSIKDFEQELTAPDQFDPATLDWVISGLLASDLPSEEKRETLLCWKHSKYTIVVIAYGGLVHAIFLHYIGVKWSVFFKKAFSSFCAPGGPWLGPGRTIPARDKLRREYFCGTYEPRGSVQDIRNSMHHEKFFVSRLMDHETQGLGTKQRNKAGGSRSIELNERRETLLQILAAEVTMSEGQSKTMVMHCSSFDRWDRLLPHAIICHVLSFFGVSQMWLDFFLKFLEVPVRFHSDPVDTVTRTCRRGMPYSHVLSDVFGEAVLFCLDMGVNQETGGDLLYRLYNNMWFWSSNDRVQGAWATIQNFAAVTGARIHEEDTGLSDIWARRSYEQDFKIGFFKKCPVSLGLGFDPGAISKFTSELRGQLQSRNHSMLSFVQTWNSYNTVFISEVAKVVKASGRPKDLYIPYVVLFDELSRNGFCDNDERSFVGYLRAIFRQRFDVVHIPDAFSFFPSELGGLELVLGLIPFAQLRHSKRESTLALFDKFREAELKAYGQPKPGKARDRIQRPLRVQITRENPFFSYEEYAHWREDLRYGFDGELADLYRGLLGPSLTEGSYYDKTGLTEFLAASKDDGEVLQAIQDGEFPGIGLYWKGIIEHYGPKVMDRFGTIRLGDVVVEVTTHEK
ncbi:hypothetical protein PG985_011068 [Apiospora marii]|uniref:Uncharacterized protein n=1 Tax=Apiospora marii TaxID=335849 RepID=A0ABR1SUZ0_9PEZI